MPRVDLRLNAIVDAGVLAGADLPALARRAAEGGATLVQYRDKRAGTAAMVERARGIRDALAGTGVPLLVNDRVDVALAAQADGVHLGREDMDPLDARRLLGPRAIIGLTVKNAADAEAAITAPIDYACIGGVFATLSKHNPDPPLGLEGFAALRRRIRTARPDLPVGAIAGIGEGNATEIIAAGADGVALISALFRDPDPLHAARGLRRIIDQALGDRRP